MKKIYITVFVLFSISSFADAGNAYRFFAKITLKNTDTLTGYFYYYSYSEYNKLESTGESFKKFIEIDSIDIYPFISTVSIGEKNLDFSLNSSKIKINVVDIIDIRIHEYLEFPVGDRIIELNKVEYDIIKTYPVTYKVIYNEKIAENCSYVLLYWNDEVNLINHKEEISKKLIEFSEDMMKNHTFFYKYLDTKKLELLNNKILLIFDCDAL